MVGFQISFIDHCISRSCNWALHTLVDWRLGFCWLSWCVMQRLRIIGPSNGLDFSVRSIRKCDLSVNLSCGHPLFITKCKIIAKILDSGIGFQAHYNPGFVIWCFTSVMIRITWSIGPKAFFYWSTFFKFFIARLLYHLFLSCVFMKHWIGFFNLICSMPADLVGYSVL